MIYFNNLTRTCFVLAMATWLNNSWAQSGKKYALDGNQKYNNGVQYKDLAEEAMQKGDSVQYLQLNEQAEQHFLDAEVDYKKALDQNKDFLKADFNLGDALYKQGRYEEAISKFDEIIQKSPNNVVKGSSYHNIGNAHLQQFMKDPKNSEALDQSIEAYKNALRNNPGDNEARYNLEMAKRLKYQQQQQQQQQQQDNQQQDQDQQKNKEQQQQENQQQEKDNKKDKEQQQQQQQKDKKNDKNKEQEAEATANEMTKEEAERLLEALKNEEEKLQDKLKKKKASGAKKYIEKDW